jgi:hypothetical protein
VAEAQPPPFDRLDFLYTPSTDVPGDLRYFTQVLGGRAVFAIDAMGTKVAAVELTDGPPLVLLTDHVEGERPILVYSVDDLSAALDDLAARGWEREGTFEIPHGPLLIVPNAGGATDRAVRVGPPGRGRALRRTLRLLSSPRRDRYAGVKDTSLETSCAPCTTCSTTTPIPEA